MHGSGGIADPGALKEMPSEPKTKFSAAGEIRTAHGQKPGNHPKTALES
jgi:hypothetical protein